MRKFLKIVGSLAALLVIAAALFLYWPLHQRSVPAAENDKPVDAVLVGGGIMSVTLATYLQELQPDWHVELFERLDGVALESSNGWNNAGTGHSGFAELNYTPEMPDGSVDIKRAINIAEQFEISRQFWAHQVRSGTLGDPRGIINSTPHMNLCWGGENVAFIQKRVEALKASPLFTGMEITTDPAKMQDWIPLAMEGRSETDHLVATRSTLGTDVNLGEITRQFFAHLSGKAKFRLTAGVEVRSITRNVNGSWRVSAFDMNDSSKIHTVDARFVFIGAGGAALPLLQLSGIEEGKRYGGFPVGGSFLVTENPEVADRHLAKVYGKADVGSPPMSVPHLDTRVLDGRRVVLFGPFATWSSKFLKNGSYFDLPDSVTLRNVLPMLGVSWDEMGLINYLAGQLIQSHEDQMAELRRYYPAAKEEDWHLIQAGQRVQIIYNDPEKGGMLKLGTEVVMAEDRSIAALLGASPGGSTSPAIILGLLEKAFPDQVAGAWNDTLHRIIPSYGQKLNDNPALLAQVWEETSEALQLAMAPPALDGIAPGAPLNEDPNAVPHVPDIQL